MSAIEALITTWTLIGGIFYLCDDGAAVDHVIQENWGDIDPLLKEELVLITYIISWPLHIIDKIRSLISKK